MSHSPVSRIESIEASLVTVELPASGVLAVDELRLEVRRSPRRRMLGLTVDRGGQLVLSAPSAIGDSVLREFVREKKTWIYTKLVRKQHLASGAPRKDFVTGEGFAYLGRSFRLLLVERQDRPVKLEGGRFCLLRGKAPMGREHIVRWYIEHATAWIPRRVERWGRWLDVKPTGVKVLDLGNRWGSCGRMGTLNFHWAIVLLPLGVVDYVIVHELVHLREPHHTPRYWRHVERLLPDFDQRRRWLAHHGADLVAGLQ
jgi:hypothetical protein